MLTPPLSRLLQRGPTIRPADPLAPLGLVPAWEGA